MNLGLSNTYVTFNAISLRPLYRQQFKVKKITFVHDFLSILSAKHCKINYSSALINLRYLIHNFAKNHKTKYV